jgi:alkyldihydroxyacetonephosphate synthase
VSEKLHAALRSIVGADFVKPMVESSGDIAAAIASDFFRVSPRTPAEVSEVIATCAAHRTAVHPEGSGRRPTTHGRDRDRVFISTRRLDQIVQLDETSLLVHAQAGVTGTRLQEILGPRNLSLGDYPPSVLAPSLGGIIAVRTPGKSSARHGFIEDAVVGVSAVLANGRAVHTRVAPRRATGPDLLRALCGSEGTIGFITSVVMRIHRQPEARFATAYLLPSVDAAIASVYLALREEAAPSGIRIYDLAETAAHFRGLPIVDQLAAKSKSGALMTVGTAGPTDLAACDRDLVASAVRAEGGEDGDHEVAKIWWRRLHHGETTPASPPTFQVMATPRKLAAVYRNVLDAATAAGASARAHVSRFDADGAIVFFSILRGTATLSVDTTDVHDNALVELCKRTATEAGGWLPGAHGLRFAPYLASLHAELDPLGIMNPGAL